MSRKKFIHSEMKFEGALFGIVCQLRDYQLCWHVNKHLLCEMKMMNDVEISNKKKNKTALYSWFRYESEMDKWLVYLISNKHGNDHLIPEMKQADFLLMIRGEITSERKKEIFTMLKDIETVQLALEIDYSKLKSKYNLELE